METKNELLNYIHNLDDHDETSREFVNQINIIPDYLSHLNNFRFNKTWFDKMDIILCELGKKCQTNHIDTAIKIITNKIINVPIWEIYKKLKKCKIQIDVPNIYNQNVFSNSFVAAVSSDNNIESKIFLSAHSGSKKYIKYTHLSDNDDEDMIKFLINEENKYEDCICWFNFCSINNMTAIEYFLQNKENINTYISSNTNDLVVKYCIENPELINWNIFSINNNDLAALFCLRNIDKIDWISFSKNTNNFVVNYLIMNPECIYWTYFSANQNINAVKFCVDNMDKVDYVAFSSSTSDVAISKLIKDHPEKIDWNNLSNNQNNLAVSYCIENFNKIIWSEFSSNKNTLAVMFCISNSHKIVWENFSNNTNDLAVEYCIKNSNKIDYRIFPMNRNHMAIRHCINRGIIFLPYYYEKEKLESVNKLNWFPRTKINLTKNYKYKNRNYTQYQNYSIDCYMYDDNFEDGFT